MTRVQLQRYVGQWYEVAVIPNWFQRGCAHSTTAEYRLRPDDQRIDVINRCIEADGSLSEIRGVGRVVDPESNAKLEVSFFELFGQSLFWGDYWIIGLDSAYRYAVVGTPSRRYGWILSRTRTLRAELFEEALTILREQGYDPADFSLTPHPD